MRHEIGQGKENIVHDSKKKSHVLKTPHTPGLFSFIVSGATINTLEEEYNQFREIAKPVIGLEVTETNFMSLRRYHFAKVGYASRQPKIVEDYSIEDIRQRLKNIEAPQVFVDLYDVSEANFKSNNGTIHFLDTSHYYYRLLEKVWSYEEQMRFRATVNRVVKKIITIAKDFAKDTKKQ